MRFIHDDQVKSANRKLLFLSVHIIDHSLVGREHDSSIHIPVQATVGENTVALIREKFGKALVRLCDQRCPVGKEQNIFDPLITRKHVHQRNGDTRLACSRGHDQQSAPELLIQPLTQLCNRHLLIRSVRDVVADAQIGNIFPAASLDQ